MNRTQSNLRLFDKVFGALAGFAVGEHMVTPDGDELINTQMMLSVARAYVAATKSDREFDEICCHHFCILYNECPKNLDFCSKTIIASCMGLPVKEWKTEAYHFSVDHKQESLSNGALTRCLFPAIIGDQIAAMSQGKLTHNSEESLAAIQAYCRLMKEYLSSTQSKKLKALKQNLMAPTSHVTNTLHNSIQWATSISFKEAIRGAAGDGGDAGAITALTGGLAGARFGFTKIPAEFIRSLDDQVYTELRELAEKAIELIDWSMSDEH